MITGIEVDTTVPESTATNMPTTSPEIAVKTSRGERTVSGAEEGEAFVTGRMLLCRKLIRVNYTLVVA
jgi:hypothetical protein